MLPDGTENSDCSPRKCISDSPYTVIEISLFTGGSVGLMKVEVPDRNPNTSDLILEAYDREPQQIILNRARALLIPT